MSHVIATKAHIKDLDALERSGKHHGVKLRRNVPNFKWYGVWMNDYRAEQAAVTQGFDPKEFGKCEHVLSLKNADGSDYEIGVVKRKDGDGWTLLYDNWGPGRKLETACGVGLSRLKQTYLEEVLKEESRETLIQNGWEVSREQLEDGRVLVEWTLRE